MRRCAACLVAILLVAACGGSATPTAGGTVQSPGLPTAEPTPAITAEPTEPPSSETPAATPSREQAYQQLLASIPADIVKRCGPVSPSWKVEDGQFAEADCTLAPGSLANYVSYELYDGVASMNARFDIQRKGHENAGTTTGPGCGKGPGEGSWTNGRKDCFKFITSDAQVMWTDEQLFIYAIAVEDNGDWARLEEFWKTAGPLGP